VWAYNCTTRRDGVMISDLIVAYNALCCSVAFTVSAIFTLALGIGANATTFTAANFDFCGPYPDIISSSLDRKRKRNLVLVRNAMRRLRITYREGGTK